MTYKSEVSAHIAAVHQACKGLDVTIEPEESMYGFRLVTSFDARAFTELPGRSTREILNNYTGRLWRAEASLRPLTAQGVPISIYDRMTEESLRKYKKMAIYPAWPNPLPNFSQLVRMLQDKSPSFYLI
jgi:hypothetical protein